MNPPPLPVLRSLLLCCLTASASLADADTVRVLTSVEPVRYLVERVGEDEVDVESVVKAGYRPEAYEPTARQVASLAEARIFFGVGMPLESLWRRQVTDSGALEARWVDLSAGLRETDPGTQESVRHTGHDHGGDDPHVWLDPRNARRMVSIISDVLSRTKPDRAGVFSRNAARLSAEIDALHRDVSGILAQAGIDTFLVFHPAWGHFARAYGIEQIAVESGGKEPGPKALAGIIDEARREGIKTVFIEPQHSRRLAETIAAAIDGEVALLDPLAYDYVDNLRKVALALAASQP